MVMVEFKVSEFEHGMSLEKFCKKKLSNAPSSIFFKLFRKRDVKVNGKREKENFEVQENDIIQIFITKQQELDFLKPSSPKNIDLNFGTDLEVIYEDLNLIIVNKPKGLLTVSDINEKKIILVNKVNAYLKSKGFNFDAIPIHRIDKNTRGLVMFAKNQKTLNYFNDLLKTKEKITKHYFALVKGKTESKGTINKPLYKDEKANIVKVDNVRGKESLTIYNTLKSNGKYSLVDVNLVTGRTHQIRVHFSSISHPLIGDKKYGDKELNDYFHKKYNHDFQFLIAYKIKFGKLENEFEYLSNKKFEIGFTEKEKRILKDLNL